jgi:hypothetical protein
MPRLCDGKPVGLAEPPAPPLPTTDLRTTTPRGTRDRVRELLIQMHDADAIAIELGMTREQVAEIENEIKQAWNRRRMLARAERVDEELGYLEQVRALALDHYERSTRPRIEKSRERTVEPQEFVPGNLEGEDVLMSTGRRGGAKHKLSRKTLERDGEIAALRLVVEVGKEIRTMMGIDAPEVKRLQLEGHVDVEHYDSGRLAQLDATELAELHRVAIERSRAS